MMTDTHIDISKLDNKDTAQRCKTSLEISPVIRCGCVCGCSPDYGYLNLTNDNISQLNQARINRTTQSFYQGIWVDMQTTEVVKHLGDSAYLLYVKSTQVLKNGGNAQLNG